MKYMIYLCLLLSTTAYSQHTFTATVVDHDSQEPLLGATVKTGPDTGAVTNANGQVAITGLAGTSVTVTVSFVGYEAFTATYPLPQTEPAVIELAHDHELEAVVVMATRTSRTIDDIPTRIEVIGTEEMEEKAMMRSANMAMVLRESTGIQMQQTSASSGNQSIRIQGLDGRYTQVLKDGFPQYSGFAGGLSIMQIPPLDLKQVEIVKGSNATLYGGGAIAGLVNLVTITPEAKPKRRLMVDQTTAAGTTLNAFFAKKHNKVGYTLYTSANRQQAYDPNGDDFSDLPQIRSLTLNPSLFYYPNPEATLRLTLNATLEERLGGDMQVIDGSPNGIHQFTGQNDTRRLSYQLSYEQQLANNRSLSIKNSLVNFNREVSEPDFRFEGQQWASFTEATYSFGREGLRTIAGLNFYTDHFIESPFGNNQRRDYAHTTAGAFVQANYDINATHALEGGLRVDAADGFGTFVLPRLAWMVRLSKKVTTRLGGGLGYKLPTIFTEDAENLSFQGILPIDPNTMEAERSVGGNFDVNFKTAFGEHWTFSVNQLLFYTRLADAMVFREAGNGQFFFENANGPVTSHGLETNLKLTYKHFKLFANYALIDTRLRYDNTERQKPLTPKHNIGAVLMYEEHGAWRIGLEAYYTGQQFLENGSRTNDFWVVGIMAMRKFGVVSAYINFENMGDTRQHRLESFAVGDHVKPEFPEIWAPLDGHIVNGGIIIEW